MALVRGFSLVAVGGMLGVTAAAAMRWLDGGEFRLFPPPSSSASVSRLTTQHQDQQQQQQQQHHHQETDFGRNVTSTSEDGGLEEVVSNDSPSVVEFADDDDHDEDDNDDCDDEINNPGEEYEEDQDDDEEGGTVVAMQERLIEQIEGLSKAIESQSATQEKLLQRLANTASITDSSMNLLRNNSVLPQTPPGKGMAGMELDTSSLLTLLNETKDDLCRFSERVAPHTNGNRQEWQYESERLLSKLESCIEMVQEATIVRSTTGSTDSLTLQFHDTPTTTTSPLKSFSHQPMSTTPTNRTGDGSNSVMMVDALLPTPSMTNSSPLGLAIRKIADNNDPSTLKVGSQLLYLYLVNLSGKPDNPRYRKIYTSNESFRKVDTLIGGKDLLFAVGFEEADGGNNKNKTLDWVPSGSSELENVSLVKVKAAAGALAILKSGKPSDELTNLALSKLPPEVSADLEQGSVPPPPPPDDRDEDDDCVEDRAPETPLGTSVVSPPTMRKKLPFPSSSGTPTNLSDVKEISFDHA